MIVYYTVGVASARRSPSNNGDAIMTKRPLSVQFGHAVEAARFDPRPALLLILLLLTGCRPGALLTDPVSAPAGTAPRAVSLGLPATPVTALSLPELHVEAHWDAASIARAASPGWGDLPAISGQPDLPEARFSGAWPTVQDVHAKLAMVTVEEGLVVPVRLVPGGEPTATGDRVRLRSHEEPAIVRLSENGRKGFAAVQGQWSGSLSFLPGHIAVMDFSHPEQPIMEDEIAAESDITALLPWKDRLLVAESRQEHATPLPGSLRVIDLGGAGPAREIGRLPGGTDGIAVDGDLAFALHICARNQVGAVLPKAGEPWPEGYPAFPDAMVEYVPRCLAVVDLAAPTQPALLAEVELAEPAWVRALATRAGYVYLLDDDGLRVVDARDPRRPVLLDHTVRLRVSEPAFVVDDIGGGGAWELAANDDNLVAIFDTTVVAFDVTDPASPRPTAQYQLPADAPVDGLILEGDSIHVPAGDLGLWTFAGP